MDFTKIECISGDCIGKHIIMEGAGGSFGGRVSMAKVKCPSCGMTLLIIPMNEKFEYEIRAPTKEERVEERVEKARKESDLALAQTITRIRETGY